jgi:uncharacterized membrane protein YheB (UPF0754 family)
VVASCLLAVLAGVAVGGLVGFLTNEVAVWLLFHPVRPRCLWRFCLWGVVPSRGRELAARMARVLEEYMLSPRVWGRLEEEMRRALVEEAERVLRGAPLLGVLGLGDAVHRVAEGLASVAASAAAGLLRRVDLARLAGEEFNRLGPEELERLFREVAGRELRVVVYSGLVLGAVVGLLQGLLLCLLG